MAVSVLNVLPHRGGGAETFIDCLESLDGYTQWRRPLSTTRSPLAAGFSILSHWPGIAAASRHAQLLQTHGDVASMLSLPLLRARPSVAVTHGLHLLRRARGARLRAVRRGMAAVVGAASRTVCNSESECEELAALVPGALLGRLVVIHNTAPPGPSPGALDPASVRAELGLDPAAAVALYVGQLEARKEPLTAIRAAAAAGVEGAPLTLLVAGDGPLLADARALAGEHVRVLGQRPDVERLLAAADIFVMPSAREGLSMAVLEAMRAGLAMVVSDGPGNPEAVGDAGLVFAVGDERALRETLARLAADAPERERLGRLARERYERQFSTELFLERIRAVYEEVLAGSRATSPGGSRR